MCNVSNHELCHRNLNDLASPHDGEFLFLLDAALEAPELLLFTPVIERSHQHDTDHREENGGTLDPAGLRLRFIFYTASSPSTVCREGEY